MTVYSEVLISNIEIWEQAIMAGILVVGVGGLMGFLVSSVAVFFKMLSR